MSGKQCPRFQRSVLWSRVQRLVPGLWTPTAAPSEQGLRVYGSRAFDRNFEGWWVHSETQRKNFVLPLELFSFSSDFLLPVFSPFSFLFLIGFGIEVYF